MMGRNLTLGIVSVIVVALSVAIYSWNASLERHMILSDLAEIKEEGIKPQTTIIQSPNVTLVLPNVSAEGSISSLNGSVVVD